MALFGYTVSHGVCLHVAQSHVAQFSLHDVRRLLVMLRVQCPALFLLNWHTLLALRWRFASHSHCSAQSVFGRYEAS